MFRPLTLGFPSPRAASRRPVTENSVCGPARSESYRCSGVRRAARLPPAAAAPGSQPPGCCRLRVWRSSAQWGEHPDPLLRVAGGVKWVNKCRMQEGQAGFTETYVQAKHALVGSISSPEQDSQTSKPQAPAQRATPFAAGSLTVSARASPSHGDPRFLAPCPPAAGSQGSVLIAG